MAGCGKRPSVDPVLVGEFLERPLRKVLDDLLQDGVDSLARCLGFGFHGTRIVYEEGRPRQRVSFLSGGFAETPRADSRTRASRRDRPSPQWPRLLRRITPRGMACHVLLTSARRRLRLPECAGRASCRARRRSIARQIGNEGDSDARLEMQSKPPQGQMASRPFRRGGKKQNPLWDGSGNFNVLSMDISLTPQERAFNQSEVMRDAERLLEEL